MPITETAPPSSRVSELASQFVVRGQKPATANRFACIDLLRTIAILTTLSLHLLGSGAATPTKNAFYPLFFHGAYGVIIFFAVSGFVISYTTAARDKNLCQINMKTFYQNRVARISPLLFLILGLGFVFRECPPLGKQGVFWACFNNPTSTYDWSFWLSIPTFWFNWIVAYRHQTFGLHWDVMWTLSIEEQFYVFFPLVLRACQNNKTLTKVLAAIVVIGPVVRAVKYLYHPKKYVAAALYSFSSFDQIAIGCLTFLLWNKYQHELKARPKLQLALTICGAATIALTYYFTSPFVLRQAIYAPTLMAGGVGMFMLGALGMNVFEKIPKFLLAPGKLSYGMYLYQGIALYFVFNYLHGQKFWFALPAFIGSVFCIAWVSFKFYEAPMNKLLRSKKGDAHLTATEVQVVPPPVLTNAG